MYGAIVSAAIVSAAFTAPCRAYRVAELLRARKTYDVDYFASMQMDVLSVCERALTANVPALMAWNGRFTPDSGARPQAYHLRLALVREFGWMARR